MQDIKPVPVQPIARARRASVVSRDSGCSGVEEVDLLDYPESPRGVALRTLRVERNISMGDLSRALHVSVAEVSGLENGRYTLSESEWTVVERTLARLPAADRDRRTL